MWGTIHNKIPCSVCGAPLAPQIEGTNVKCAHCGKGHTSIVPPPPSDADLPERGDAVAVQWGERWWPARLIERLDQDRFLVHYDGWGPAFDEAVDISRLRKRDEERDGSTLASIFRDRQTVNDAGGRLVIYLLAVAVSAAVFGAGMSLFVDPVDSGRSPAPSMLSSIGGNRSASAPPNIHPVTAEDRLVPGTRIYFMENEQWKSAEIISIRSDGKVKIRFEDRGVMIEALLALSQVRLPN